MKANINWKTIRRYLIQSVVVISSLLIVSMFSVRAYSPVGEQVKYQGLTIQELGSSSYQVVDLYVEDTTYMIPSNFKTSMIDSAQYLGNSSIVETLIIPSSLQFFSDSSLSDLTSLKTLEVDGGSSIDYVKRLRPNTLPTKELYLVEDNSKLFMDNTSLETTALNKEYYINIVEGQNLDLSYNYEKVQMYRYDGHSWVSDVKVVKQSQSNYQWYSTKDGKEQLLSGNNELVIDDIQLGDSGRFILRDSLSKNEVIVNVSVKTSEEAIHNVKTGLGLETYTVWFTLVVLLGSGSYLYIKKKKRN